MVAIQWFNYSEEGHGYHTEKVVEESYVSVIINDYICRYKEFDICKNYPHVNCFITINEEGTKIVLA